jgi:hypothetical protein
MKLNEFLSQHAANNRKLKKKIKRKLLNTIHTRASKTI